MVAYLAVAALGLIMSPTPVVVTRSSGVSMMAAKKEETKGWFFGDWLTGPGLAKFTDGRRELLAPRPFNAGTFDKDSELKKYDTRLNGQESAAAKAKASKSYTTFPFDKINKNKKR